MTDLVPCAVKVLAKRCDRALTVLVSLARNDYSAPLSWIVYRIEQHPKVGKSYFMRRFDCLDAAEAAYNGEFERRSWSQTNHWLAPTAEDHDPVASHKTYWHKVWPHWIGLAPPSLPPAEIGGHYLDLTRHECALLAELDAIVNEVCYASTELLDDGRLITATPTLYPILEEPLVRRWLFEGCIADVIDPASGEPKGIRRLFLVYFEYVGLSAGQEGLRLIYSWLQGLPSKSKRGLVRALREWGKPRGVRAEYQRYDLIIGQLHS